MLRGIRTTLNHFSGTSWLFSSTYFSRFLNFNFFRNIGDEKKITISPIFRKLIRNSKLWFTKLRSITRRIEWNKPQSRSFKTVWDEYVRKTRSKSFEIWNISFSMRRIGKMSRTKNSYNWKISHVCTKFQVIGTIIKMIFINRTVPSNV